MFDYSSDIRSPYLEDLMWPEFSALTRYPEVEGFEYLTGKYLVYHNERQSQKKPMFIGKCHGSKVTNRGLVLLLGLPCEGDVQVAVDCEDEEHKLPNIFGYFRDRSEIKLKDILEFEDYESARLFCDLGSD